MRSCGTAAKAGGNREHKLRPTVTEGSYLLETSGELFERFAKEVKEKIKLDIKAVGTIRVDEVYSVAPPEPGKKIA